MKKVFDQVFVAMRIWKLDFISAPLISRVIRLLKYCLALISFAAFAVDAKELNKIILSIPAESFKGILVYLKTHTLQVFAVICTVVLFIFDKELTPDDSIIETEVLKTNPGISLMQKLRDYYNKADSIFTLSEMAHGMGVYSSKTNEEILYNSLKGKSLISLNLSDRVMKAYIPETVDKNTLKKHSIKRKLRLGAQIKNDRKIRLASDITFPLPKKVDLEETDYISSLMTDQLAFIHVTIEGSETPIHHGTTQFISQNSNEAFLRSLVQSRSISNQLGASTLAFSSDGYLMLVWQSKKNAQSKGLLAPSGSGSLDWSDIGDQKSLFDLVKQGAARELVEECGLESKRSCDDIKISSYDVAQSQIIPFAFSRMLHRAGKPEFYCLAKLPFTANQIDAAKLSKKEDKLTLKTQISNRAPKVNFDSCEIEITRSLKAVCKGFTDLEGLSDMITDRELLGISFPLQHALNLLDEALERDSENRIAAFLKSI